MPLRRIFRARIASTRTTVPFFPSSRLPSPAPSFLPSNPLRIAVYPFQRLSIQEPLLSLSPSLRVPLVLTFPFLLSLRVVVREVRDRTNDSSLSPDGKRCCPLPMLSSRRNDDDDGVEKCERSRGSKQRFSAFGLPISRFPSLGC